MTKPNERLATFKINDKKWTKFKIKTRKAGKTATDVLLNFIDNYLSSNIDEIDSLYIDNQDIIDELKKKLGLPSLKDDLKTEIFDIVQGLNERLNSFDERLGAIEIAITKSQDNIDNIDIEEAITTPLSKTEGLTYQELAAKEGLNKSTVRSWRDKQKIPAKGDNAKYSELYEIKNGKFYPK